MDNTETNKRQKKFEDVCKEAGIKLTHQRIEIFREVSRSLEHPDAEQVFQGVRERIPTISLDTVYRTLWMLTDLNLIKTFNIHYESTRFDANLHYHHHFVCTRCGLIRDFNDPELKDLKIPVVLSEIGQIESTHVEVRGICATCSKDPVKNTTPKNP